MCNFISVNKSYKIYLQIFYYKLPHYSPFSDVVITVMEKYLPFLLHLMRCYNWISELLCLENMVKSHFERYFFITLKILHCSIITLCGTTEYIYNHHATYSVNMHISINYFDNVVEHV